MLQERAGLDQKQLESYQRERDGLYEQFKGMAFGRGRLPPELSRQLAELSRTISQPAIRSRNRHQQARHRHPLRQRRGRAEARRRATARRIGAGAEVAGGGRSENHGRRPHRQPVDRRQGSAGEVSQQLPPQHGPGAGRGRPDEAGRPARAADGRGRFRRHASRSPRTPRPRTARRTAAWKSSSWPPTCPVVGWSDSTPSVYAAGVKR